MKFNSQIELALYFNVKARSIRLGYDLEVAGELAEIHIEMRRRKYSEKFINSNNCVSTK